MATAAQIKATAKYDKANTTGFYVKFNNKTDKDILEYLSTVKNKQGLIKQLIREHMAVSVPDSVPDCTIVPVSVPNKFMKDLKKEAKENNETVSELIWLVALQDMPWLTNK